MKTQVTIKEKHFKYKFKDIKIISDFDILKLRYYEDNMAFDDSRIYNFIFEKYNNNTIYVKVEFSTEQFKSRTYKSYNFFEFITINYKNYSYLFNLDCVSSLKDLGEDSKVDYVIYGFLYKKLILENPEFIEYIV